MRDGRREGHGRRRPSRQMRDPRRRAGVARRPGRRTGAARFLLPPRGRAGGRAEMPARGLSRDLDRRTPLPAGRRRPCGPRRRQRRARRPPRHRGGALLAVRPARLRRVRAGAGASARGIMIGWSGVRERRVSDEDMAVLGRWVEAFNRRDLEDLAALSDTHCELRPYLASMIEHSAYRGHDGLTAYFEDADAAWERIQLALGETFARSASVSWAPWRSMAKLAPAASRCACPCRG